MYFAGSDHQNPMVTELNQTCSQGHRSSLTLLTQGGGSICLLCLSNLISNPKSPTIHVSYALSQLSHAISQPTFLHNLLTFHPHFLVSPLVVVLSSFDDEPIAKQTTDLISDLCDHTDGSVYGEFIARVSDRLSSGSLAWSRRQVYMLHCLGILLDYQKNDPCTYIKDKSSLVFNLVTGLRLPSEEIQGEILFVLYKISTFQDAYKDDDGHDVLCAYCPKLLHLSLEALMKTQHDDVRLNSVALLSVLAQRGFFMHAFVDDTSSREPFEADNFMQITDEQNGPPLNLLFAEAIKAPLLSSDTHVQTATLDLIFLYLSCEGGSEKEVQLLVDENIADYVFEILRLSGCKDPMVSSCLQVLDLLSTAESAFVQRVAIGFTTLVHVLRYVIEVPFHPVQCHSLKLLSNCVSNCPGIVSTFNIEEIGLILAGMLRKNVDGEAGILPEAFTLACSILVALMKSPSSYGTSSMEKSVQDATRNAVSACLSSYDKDSSLLLHSLYLLKEAYAYSYERRQTKASCIELSSCILDVCKTQLLPWLVTNIHEMEEDMALGVFESFHSILLQDSDIQTKEFVDILLSSSWFSFSFGCLGLFPTEKMKWRVYLLFGSILDVLLGNGSSQVIRDAALHLPSDPVDLLFLLGQKSSHNVEVLSCQSAVLFILYASSLYNDRIADDKMVLASLEQYILLNSSELLYGTVEPMVIEQMVNLYGLYRGLAKVSYQISYSPEAERTLFHLVAEKELDLLSTRVHFISLKWFFQQEGIYKSLSNQILKLCRYYCSSDHRTQIVVPENDGQKINVGAIAELVASGDNFGATIMVCLLRELVEEGSQVDDIILVLSMITVIIDMRPAASDQLCLNGIGTAMQNLYYHSRHSSSTDVFMAISQLVFKILCSVHSQSLTDEEAWLAVTMKLLDYLIPTVSANGWTRDALILTGILSLILHHSIDQTLVEASKAILLSSPLVSTISNIIYEACSKGPALLDHDEGTKTGETLIFLLLLHYFSLKSVLAVLPGIVDAQNLLGNDKGKQPLSYISIHCHYLCRLLHLGSAPVKLVASYCLLEQFHTISEQKRKEPDKLKCSSLYLLSTKAVLESLIFCIDIRVAMNCALCLSMVLGWEKEEMQAQVIENNTWCRLIVEELAVSLAVPCLASKSFMIHHMPAVYVAVSLLKLRKVSPWMRAVFDDSCISAIIQNLSTCNLTSEIVLLFRELLNSGYLKAEQIASLNRLFQASRKHMYSDNVQDVAIEENGEKVVVIPDDLGTVCEFLINLMASHSSPNMDSMRSHTRNKELLQEIELFCKALMDEDDG